MSSPRPSVTHSHQVRVFQYITAVETGRAVSTERSTATANDCATRSTGLRLVRPGRRVARAFKPTDDDLCSCGSNDRGGSPKSDKEAPLELTGTPQIPSGRHRDTTVALSLRTLGQETLRCCRLAGCVLSPFLSRTGLAVTTNDWPRSSRDAIFAVPSSAAGNPRNVGPQVPRHCGGHRVARFLLSRSCGTDGHGLHVGFSEYAEEIQ
ncbi:hypothetical protein MNBD_ACTINO02-1181 [hydrothermal vent metagenome]|uniref:Uncharacterized protein n=1 Tax=hydrothermal vent metagenome TaxID=652676 RepID=A0A3B0T1L8_9ZZZZ